ncbi:MAG TPA: 50S ribosomal protein L4 [Phycisphaerae bacterium]|nr:50S ribosomal protein L4 [Phycisphaerae bacterium]
MIEVKVYNSDGGDAGLIEVDEAWFGGEVRMEVLRLAVRRHEANQHQGTAATKNRSLVQGSTRKIFRQKHTGRARAGTIRSPKRRGGGVTFAKVARDVGLSMPKKMRRQALDSALLARLLDAEIIVVEGLTLAEPKTREVARVLKAVGVERSCLLALPPGDTVLYKSARNLPRVRIRQVADLNAYDVLWPNRVVFTRSAFEAMLESRKN